jgi:hypothetical protein
MQKTQKVNREKIRERMFEPTGINKVIFGSGDAG